MKSSGQIKEIRSRLNLSQSELAEKLGVSFATVNRWEKGHCEPSQIAVNAIKNLCAENNIDFSQLEGSAIITSNEIVTLYHGSKSGLHGPIAPVSRDRCDFGKGFYMGTERMQPLTLICNYPEGKLYTLQAGLTGLKTPRCGSRPGLGTADRLQPGQAGICQRLPHLSAVCRYGRWLRYGHRVHRQRPYVCGIGPLLQWRNHRFGSDQQSICLKTGKTVCGIDRKSVQSNQNLG